MSPPYEEGRPGGITTRTAHKSNAKDSNQNTPSGYGRVASEEVNRG